MSAGGPLGDDLPHEVELASYRNEQLRLTNQRVRYKGRGLRKHERHFVRLSDITAVGINRRFGLHPGVLGLPGGLVALGFLAFAVTGWDDYIFVGFTAALVTTPFAVLVNWIFGATLAIRITTPGHTVTVRVPRRLMSDAHGFINRVEAERARGVTPADAGDVFRPTARPFGATREPLHPQP